MFRLKLKKDGSIIYEIPELPTNDFINECKVKYKNKSICGINWDNVDFEVDGYTKQQVIDKLNNENELKQIYKNLKSRLLNIETRLSNLESKAKEFLK